MKSTKIVTSFLTSNKKILILKRSNTVRSMKGLWGGVSGKIEVGEEPLERAKTEILEEVGATHDEIKLLKSADRMFVSSPKIQDRRWEIFPFLFHLRSEKISLNWENTSYRWISPDEIYNYKTVPSLDEVLFKLL